MIKLNNYKINNSPKACIENLYARVCSCDACELCNTRTNVVFGCGNIDAQVLIVGEAPGKNEDESGNPFVGAAGKNLDKLLHVAHLTRRDVYIANVLKCRPPNNRNPYAKEIKACSPFLHEQLSIIKPQVVVTLGNFATKFFLNTKFGITQLHGRIFHANELVIYPIFHPASVLYDRKKEEALQKDFEALGEILKGLRNGERK